MKALKSIKKQKILIETGRKIFNKIKRSDYGEGNYNIISKIVRYQGINCYIPKERVDCFF